MSEKSLPISAEYGSLPALAGVKRTICKYFTEGHCEKGTSCTFAHGEHEIGEAMPEDAAVKPIICKHWIDGHCHTGDTCRFAHGNMDRREAIVCFEMIPSAKDAEVKRTLCKFWADGECKLGENCTFAHGEQEIGETIVPADDPEIPRAKTSTPYVTTAKRTLCKFWEEGRCKLGTNCTFAHGEHEIGERIVPGYDPVIPQEKTSTPYVATVKRTLCKFWEEGHCRLGENCSFAHGEQKIGEAIVPADDPEIPREKTSTPYVTTAKRTLCKFWEEGHCKLGRGCTFAHGVREIGEVITPSTTQPWHEERSPRHGATVKQTVCKFWDDGYCKLGKDCTFAHGEHEIGDAIIPPKLSQSRSEEGSPRHSIKSISGWRKVLIESKRAPCKSWAEGYCGLGNKCPYAHEDPVVDDGARSSKEPRARREDSPAPRAYTKRTMCKFWEEGTCKLSKNCTYAHGEEEIGDAFSLRKEPRTQREDSPPRHDANAKRTTCKFWEDGYCRLGTKCTFAHGDRETSREQSSPRHGANFKRTVAHEDREAPQEQRSPRHVAYYKRHPCKFWDEGHCKLGRDCTYAHGESDVNAITSSKAAQDHREGDIDYAITSSKATQESGPPPSGANFKRTLCKFWNEGHCKLGDACSYAHGNEQVGARVAAPAATAAPTATTECKYMLCWYFEQGHCGKGDNCTFAHGKDQIGTHIASDLGRSKKTTICKFWEDGHCERGNSCAFAHGKQEVGLDKPAEDTRRPCKFWQEGHCKQGDFCAFEHRDAKVGEIPPSKYYKKAMLSKSDDDESLPVDVALPKSSSIRHRAASSSSIKSAKDLGKKAPCKFWQESGFCLKAHTCKLAHDQPNISRTKPAIQPPPPPPPLPPAPPPPTPPRAQPPTKRTLCSFWQAGNCEKGSKCNFAHGNSELLDSELGGDGLPTKLCMHWEQGKCHRGAACTFAHGKGEMKRQSPAMAPIVLELRDRTPKTKPAQSDLSASKFLPLAPAKTRMTICKYWRDGVCRDGSKCVYAHGDAEITHPQSAAQEVKRTICKFWEDGHCGRGSACTFAHGVTEIGQICEQNAQSTAWEFGDSKRTICKFWEEGTCDKGLSCTFAHGKREIGQMITTTPSSTSHLPEKAMSSGGEKARTDAFPQANRKVKTTICALWDDGYCQDGTACTLAHGEHELGKGILGSRTGPSRPCRHWQAGYCEQGSKCGFSHEAGQDVKKYDRKRPRICKFWEEGKCERGVSCYYAHGDQEHWRRSSSRTRTLRERTRSPDHERDSKRRRTSLR